MMVASIETTLELWASTLRDVKRRLRGLFAQERSAANAESFLDGLLGDERRKTGRHATGSACPQVLEPKARGCTTGATSNWLILKPKTSTMKIMAHGQEDC